MTPYTRLARLRTAQEFAHYLESLGVQLGFDETLLAGEQSPMSTPLTVGEFTIGNRYAVLPMEGWDGTTDGRPSDLTTRRWEHFGISGAKLIWGGEAVAVQASGRANPNQLMINQYTVGDLAALRQKLVTAHREQFGRDDDLLIGLQLTHSGRFARPVDKKRMEPRILYHHPILDRKFGIQDDSALMSDDEIQVLIADFVRAAVLAQQAGFHFVDVKHCHGYLGHEFLSAVDRAGRYGGSFENRTRFLREIVEGIRQQAPTLQIGVRLSAFDWMPFRAGAEGFGEPEDLGGKTYPYNFGGDATGLGIDLTEPRAFLDLLDSLGIKLVCITAGSPYYNPHIQRPAYFPPSDGYLPPEDPLVGVARQIEVVRQLKRSHPQMVLVGSGYSYLQEWLPHVAQYVVRTGGADFVGLGRMVLAYPSLPADVLAGRPLQRKQFCRTFSDCTTAPRHGMVSGCYPLDDFYKARPENERLLEIKQSIKS